MIITIAGEPGSGKTTIARMLAEKLGWPSYDVGNMRRQAAKARGLTLEEYNRLGEKDPSTDKEVDAWQKELGQKEDNFIIQGRMSWHFIPDSLKIYLKVNPREGAKRIFEQLQNNERQNEFKEFKTVGDVADLNAKRVVSDKKRYSKYYGVDAYDESNFDLIVDTTGKSIAETFETVWQSIKVKTD